MNTTGNRVFKNKNFVTVILSQTDNKTHSNITILNWSDLSGTSKIGKINSEICQLVVSNGNRLLRPKSIMLKPMSVVLVNIIL